MEIPELKQEYNEWMNTVRLAHYKRMKANLETLSDYEKNMFSSIRQALFDNGYSEEVLNQEVSSYQSLSDDERIAQLKEKVDVLVKQIEDILDGTDEISSSDFPELYHRIQELIAYDSDKANELIQEAYESAGISHYMNCGDSLFGRPCTYYFSRKLSSK